MAIQFVRVEYASRSKGQNACQKSAYNARCKITDNATGKTYDFSKKGSHVYHEILLPDHVDISYKNPSILSNEVESKEKRVDSQLFKDIVIALPDDKEFSLEDKIELVHKLIDKRKYIQEGLGVQFDIHSPHEGDRNWHAHLLVTTRRFSRDGTQLEPKKARDLNPKVVGGKAHFVIKEEGQIHEEFKDLINDKYKELGIDRSVDAISVIPQIHVGPVRTRAIVNQNVDYNKEVLKRNKELILDPDTLISHITKYQSVFNKKDILRYLKPLNDLDIDSINSISESLDLDINLKPFTSDNPFAKWGHDKKIQEAITNIKNKLTDYALSNKDILPLYNSDKTATNLFTTKTIRLEEEKLLRLGSYTHSAKNLFCSNLKIFNRTITAFSQNDLSPHQSEALFQILSSKSGLNILKGRAGTGKSHLLGTLNTIAKQVSISTVALAPTHKAKIELSNQGFDNVDTIKGFLFKLYNNKVAIPTNSLIIVDEAAMVGNTDMTELLRVAAHFKCNILLSGDDRQLSSVSRGQIFIQYSKKFGYAEISKVKRQKSEWAKKVSESFASSNIEQGLQILEDHSKLIESPTKIESIEKLMTNWQKSKYDIKDRLIVTPKNKDVDLLNNTIFDILQANGALDEKTYNISKDNTIEKFSKGARIVFTKTNKDLGINNGDFGTLTNCTKDEFVVLLDKNIQPQVGNKTANKSSDLIKFNPEEFHHLKLGYASNIYKSQGASISDVYVYHNGFTTSQNNYVAMSRHIYNLHLYVNQESTQSKTHLIQQMKLDLNKGMSIDYLVESDLVEQQKSFFTKISNSIKNSITPLVDKNSIDHSYYKIDMPEITNATVQETIANVYDQKDQYYEDLKGLNIEQPKEIDIKKAVGENTYIDANIVKQEAKYNADSIAIDILGAPNKNFSNSRNLRFGSTGKIAVCISGSKSGTWYDFSSDRGGDIFKLVQEYKNYSFSESLKYLSSKCSISIEHNKLITPTLKLVEENRKNDQYIDDVKKQRYAQKLYSKSQDLHPDSIASKYLKSRSITSVFNKEDIKYKKSPEGTSLIAFARDKDCNITGGIQIALDPATSNKAQIDTPKKAFGKIKGSFVQVSPYLEQKNPEIQDFYKSVPATVTVIAEGLETALSIAQSLLIKKTPNIKVVCSLGVNNIQNYKPLDNETLIIAKDNDGPLANTNYVIDKTVEKLKHQTLVATISPKIGDFNDVLQKDGPGEIQKLFTPVIDKLKRYNNHDIAIICSNRNNLDKSDLSTFIAQNTIALGAIKFNDPSFCTNKLSPLPDITRYQIVQFHKKNLNDINKFNRDTKFAIKSNILTTKELKEYIENHDANKARAWAHKKCREFVHQTMYSKMSELKTKSYTIYNNKKFYNVKSLLEHFTKHKETLPYVGLTAKEELSKFNKMQNNKSHHIEHKQEHHIEHEFIMK